MTNLSCNASTCTHNADKCCCLSGIDVKGLMHVPAMKHAVEALITKENGSARNAAASPKLNLTIQCAAHNCVYNEDSACHADHVDISGITAVNAGDTVCSTFTAK